jgi:signal peptidase I
MRDTLVFVRGIMRFVLWAGGIGGAIALLLYLFVFDTWVVPSTNDHAFEASVLPALMPEDKVLLKRGSVPGYGELARCQHPTDSSWVVGRVLGVAGEHVEISDKGVTTNGKALNATHACEQRVVTHPVTENLVTMNCGVAETGSWSFEYLTPKERDGVSAGATSATVESGKVFLVSDNRLMHQDSRDFGQVDVTTCSHIVYRLWGERFTDSSRRFTILW